MRFFDPGADHFGVIDATRVGVRIYAVCQNTTMPWLLERGQRVE
jgi:hypothetical protein